MSIDDFQLLTDASYVVVDFETVTPRGRPAEPIELAAVRIGPGLVPDATFGFSRLIKPPDGAPITSFDTAQTGITVSDVKDAAGAEVVLREFERWLGDSSHIFVAQNAAYEAGIFSRFATVCPSVAAAPFVDTVALGKAVVSGLGAYKLDAMAEHFRIPVPRGRHRALPDVQLTVRVFLELLRVAASERRIANIGDLRRLAELKQRRSAPTQGGLFGDD